MTLQTTCEIYSPEKLKRETDAFMQMISYTRPAFSKHETRFVERFIVPTGAKPDAYGNYILRIGTAPILWSSHTDTVHTGSGYFKPVLHANGTVLMAHADVNCLGADCTSGVWLMLQMIFAEVEGLYIFHKAEEKGALGSKYIAKTTPELLDGIKYAIAFDRQGTDSIITYQMASRCCSDMFANSLASKLNVDGFNYKKDDGGVYTDTAMYTKLIPECTNISVGYYNQHTKTENQDLIHLFKLRDVLVKADFSNLPCVRETDEKDTLYNETDYYGSNWVSYRKSLSIEDIVIKYPDRIAYLLESLYDYDVNTLLNHLCENSPYADDGYM